MAEELVLNLSIAEAAGLSKVCDAYCTCTLQLEGPGPQPRMMMSPRGGAATQQVTKTETARRTDVPKWKSGVGRYTVKSPAPASACFEVCLLANRLLGKEVLGRATVELVELLAEHRTDRWYSLKDKRNADAGSVRLLTALDGHSPRDGNPKASVDMSPSLQNSGQGMGATRDVLAPEGPATPVLPPSGAKKMGMTNTGRPNRGARTGQLWRSGPGSVGGGGPPLPPSPGQGPGGQGGAGPGQAFQYKIGDMVGRGAFGKVFQAMNLENGELMAVKCVELNNVSAEELEEIKNEVNLLRTLRHRHVVSYIGTHTMEGSFNILMEYCPGGSVSTLLAAFGPFEERVLSQYARQCYEGLAYIHSHAVMHRDIKGANILVAANGILKIADFGASAQLRGTVTETNDTASMKGTPFWMAPEVIKQERYGRGADCWSMGMTVIEMATANHPWQKATNKFSLMYEIASTDHLPEMPTTLSDQCKDFILQSINRDVEARMSAEAALSHPFLANIVTRKPIDY